MIKQPYFRSILSLGNFRDDEKKFPDSIVELSDYEDLSSMVNRFLSGEYIPTRQMGYDVPSGVAGEEAYEREDITKSDGFDISDLPPLQESIKRNLAKIAKKPGGKKSDDSDDVLSRKGSRRNKEQNSATPDNNEAEPSVSDPVPEE
ncbi:MAG: hypothetical protein LBQ47_03805 [Endomicrobium sp.]|jgi:hypothetical protein|nr:hypothetical protein [Endomicrobium sp.]